MSRRALPAMLTLAMAAGCTGSGQVRTIPPIRSDFPAQEPLVATIPITEAYHWSGPDGELNIAMAHRSRSWLNKAFDTQWLMSIVLPELPAGSEKLYQVRRREMRMVSSHVGGHQRGQSAHGIIVIESPQAGRLKGRFHVWIRQQQFGFLTGWTPPMNRAPVQIMVGRFEAVHDPIRGQEILATTEVDELQRPPPGAPATQPGIRWLGTRPASVPAE